MTPQQLYDVVFDIGMIAETPLHGQARSVSDDFKAGGDLESAEMMLFDIIDESTHVQYAHKWLLLLCLTRWRGQQRLPRTRRGCRAPAPPTA